jgi:hypothetical protein
MDKKNMLEEINNILLNTKLDNRFAYIFGITHFDDQFSILEIDHYPDIYQMLFDEKVLEKAESYPAVLICTNGWAVQLDPDAQQETDQDLLTQIPPSEHPNRVRVQLRIMYDKEHTFNTCVLIEGQDEIMYDTEGQGDLAVAIRQIYAGKNLQDQSLISKENIFSTVDNSIREDDSDILQ